MQFVSKSTIMLSKGKKIPILRVKYNIFIKLFVF